MTSHIPNNLPDFTEHTLASESLLEGGFIRLRSDRIRLPDGSEGVRQYLIHPGAVMIAAFVNETHLLFEHQYRYALRQHFLELPAGKIDPDEAHHDTARRELREETGYVAQSWNHVATMHPGIGYSTEVIELYVAHDIRYIGHQRDEGEFLEVFPLKFSHAVEMVRDGAITDGKTAFALLWLDRFGRLKK